MPISGSVASSCELGIHGSFRESRRWDKVRGGEDGVGRKQNSLRLFPSLSLLQVSVFPILSAFPFGICQPFRAGATSIRVVRSPKGFGPISKKKKPTFPKEKTGYDDDRKDEGEEEEDDLVPEVITNRMLGRMGFTVGIPLAVGFLFFPFFYYLKVVLKLDVPEWLPLSTSIVMFSIAGLGITYGVVSTSWDPLREGSRLGWKEARANWPVLWQTVQRKKGKE
eukprot:c13331_g1_i1 orf=92-760(+)